MATVGYAEGLGTGVIIHFESNSSAQLFIKHEGNQVFKFAFRYRIGQNWGAWNYLTLE